MAFQINSAYGSDLQQLLQGFQAQNCYSKPTIVQSQWPDLSCCPFVNDDNILKLLKLKTNVLLTQQDQNKINLISVLTKTSKVEDKFVNYFNLKDIYFEINLNINGGLKFIPENVNTLTITLKQGSFGTVKEFRGHLCSAEYQQEYDNEDRTGVQKEKMSYMQFNSFDDLNGKSILNFVFGEGLSCGQGKPLQAMVTLFCGAEKLAVEVADSSQICDLRLKIVLPKGYCQKLEQDCVLVNPFTGRDVSLKNLEQNIISLKVNVNHTLHLSICKSLPRKFCGQNDVESNFVCLVNKKKQSISTGKFSQFEFKKNSLQLSYFGGDPCSHDQLGKSYGSLVILNCFEGGSKIPPVVSYDPEKCQFIVKIYTKLICKTILQVMAPDQNGYFDLTPLNQTIFPTEIIKPIGSLNFTLEIGKPINRKHGCPVGAAACLTFKDLSLSLGRPLSLPTVNQNGSGIFIAYENGSACPNQSGRQLSTLIEFHCQQNAQEQISFSGIQNKCTFKFDWWTREACLKKLRTGSCSLKHGDQLLNFTSLGKQSNYQLNLKSDKDKDNITLILNICQPVYHSSFPENIQGAHFMKGNDTSFSAGQYSSQVYWENELPTLKYVLGQKCSDILYTSTVIHFMCYENNNPSQFYKIMHNSNKCQFTILWYTRESCTQLHECSVMGDDVEYNLQKLRKPVGRYSFPLSRTSKLIINICQPLPYTDQCKIGSAACLVTNAPEETQNFGMLKRGLQRDGKSLILTYSGGDKCKERPLESSTTKIIFTCGKKEKRQITPKECQYVIQYTTPFACGKNLTQEPKIEPKTQFPKSENQSKNEDKSKIKEQITKKPSSDSKGETNQNGKINPQGRQKSEKQFYDQNAKQSEKSESQKGQHVPGHSNFTSPQTDQFLKNRNLNQDVNNSSGQKDSYLDQNGKRISKLPNKINDAQKKEIQNPAEKKINDKPSYLSGQSSEKSSDSPDQGKDFESNDSKIKSDSQSGKHEEPENSNQKLGNNQSEQDQNSQFTGQDENEKSQFTAQDQKEEEKPSNLGGKEPLRPSESHDQQSIESPGEQSKEEHPDLDTGTSGNSQQILSASGNDKQKSLNSEDDVERHGKISDSGRSQMDPTFSEENSITKQPSETTPEITKTNNDKNDQQQPIQEKKTEKDDKNLPIVTENKQSDNINENEPKFQNEQPPKPVYLELKSKKHPIPPNIYYSPYVDPNQLSQSQITNALGQLQNTASNNKPVVDPNQLSQSQITNALGQLQNNKPAVDPNQLSQSQITNALGQLQNNKPVVDPNLLNQSQTTNDTVNDNKPVVDTDSQSQSQNTNAEEETQDTEGDQNTDQPQTTTGSHLTEEEMEQVKSALKATLVSPQPDKNPKIKKKPQNRSKSLPPKPQKPVPKQQEASVLKSIPFWIVVGVAILLALLLIASVTTCIYFYVQKTRLERKLCRLPKFDCHYYERPTFDEYYEMLLNQETLKSRY